VADAEFRYADLLPAGADELLEGVLLAYGVDGNQAGGAVRRDPQGGLTLVISPAKPREFARELSVRVQEWTGEWPLMS
jgi:hypothetical protein